MDRTVINETTLTNLADSIRGKSGKTEKIAPLDMPAEIAAIVSLTPYEWKSGCGLTISAANEAAYGTSGAVLKLYGKALASVSFYGTTAANFVGWMDNLPSGGTAVIYCTAAVYAALTDTEKSAVESKGYSISGSLT